MKILNVKTLYFKKIHLNSKILILIKIYHLDYNNISYLEHNGLHNNIIDYI